MAKTLPEKLLIKPGAALWISAPDHLSLLGPLPEDVQQVRDLEAATLALLFAPDEQQLRALLAEHGSALAAPTVLWVAYPKGNRSDINRDTLWPILADLDLRPVGQVAIDDTWSALRFRPLKPGEAQFTGGR